MLYSMLLNKCVEEFVTNSGRIGSTYSINKYISFKTITCKVKIGSWWLLLWLKNFTFVLLRYSNYTYIILYESKYF